MTEVRFHPVADMEFQLALRAYARPSRGMAERFDRAMTRLLGHSHKRSLVPAFHADASPGRWAIEIGGGIRGGKR